MVNSQRMMQASYMIIFIIIIYVAYCGLENPIFIYDESGQFWLSQGLNHYSEPFSPRGGFMDVIQNNRCYNLDPGGFTVLLWMWSSISSNYIYLRLLPFIFTLLSGVYTYKLIYLSSRSAHIALFGVICYVLLCTNFVKIAELRGYTMEMCGVVMGAYLITKYNELPKYRYLICLTLILSFFCTSRYSFILIAFAYSLYTCYMIIARKRNIILRLLLFGLPLLFTVVGIYMVTMRYQNADASKIDYSPYLSTSPDLLCGMLSLSVYLLLFLTVFSYYKFKKIHPVNILCMLVCTIFFIVSCMGLYPWHLLKNISMGLLMLISAIDLLSMYSSRFSYMDNVITLLSLVVACGSLFFILRFESKKNEYNETKESMKEIASLRMTSKEKLFVNHRLEPGIRYAFEYGHLKECRNKKYYPRQFVFEHGPIHSKQIQDHVIINRAEESHCKYYIFNKSQKCSGYDVLNGYPLILIRK